MEEFNSGDLVKVEKLGNSPLMLVIGTTDKKVSCLWFDKNNKKHTEVFPVEILEPADGKKDTKPINTKALF